MPFFKFYKGGKDYGVEKNGFIQEYLPYPWYWLFRRWIDFREHRFYLDRTDKTTVAIKKFYAEHADSVGETSAFNTINALHKTITYDFDYQDDSLYWKGEDYRLARLDEFLEKRTLRQISRYKLYTGLFDISDMPYFGSLVVDKRLDEISMNHPTPLEQYSTLFSTKHEGRYFFFRPKLSRFGYSVNEFPFYYEGTLGLSASQSIENLYDPGSLRFVEISNSSKDHNYRITNCLVQIEPAQGSCSFKTKLKLSGQFSTLQRGTYLHNHMDSTINLGYFQMIYNLTDHTKLIKSDMVNHHEYFPFKTDFQLEYHDNTLIEKTGDNLTRIDISNWCNFVFPENFNASGRQLAYYPDFKHSDVFRYRIVMSTPVDILNTELFNRQIENEFGTFKSTLTKVDDLTWNLNVQSSTDHSSLAADKAHLAEEIYNALIDLSQASLLIISK